MPATVIPATTQGHRCTNCFSTLSTSGISLAVAFDANHEIPDEIRSGDLNLAVCQVCGYRGWLWPGHLTVSMSANRAVFCLWEQESGGDALLQARWEALAAAGVSVSDELRSRVVWVYGYSQVYELLRVPERIYAVYVSLQIAQGQRSWIPDPHERVRQWIADTVRIGALVRTSTEFDDEFVAAVKQLLPGYLESATQGPGVGLLADALQDFLKRDSNEARKEEEAAVDAGSSDAKILPQSLLKVPSVLRTELGVHARALPVVAEIEAVKGEASAVGKFAAARALLVSSPVNPDESNGEDFSAQLIRDAPALRINLGDTAVPLAVFLSTHCGWSHDQVSSLSLLALQLLPQFQGFAGDLACVLAEKSRCSERPDLVFWSNVLCQEFFRRAGMPRSAAAANAGACLAFAAYHDRALDTTTHAMRALGACWHTAARNVLSSGNTALAKLCAGTSLRYFIAIGDVEAQLSLRLEACMIETPVVHEARSLWDDIRAQYGRVTSLAELQLWARFEAQCLVFLAKAEKKWRPEKPMILALRAEKEPPRDAPAQYRTPDVPFWLFPDGERDAESSAREERDGSVSKDGARSGTIYLQELSSDGGAIYDVWGVGSCSVQWVHTLRRSLRAARVAGSAGDWYNAYHALIVMADELYAGLGLYFYRLMQIEARSDVIGPIPDAMAPALRLVLARLLSTRIKGREGAELGGLRELLDALEDRAIDPHFARQLGYGGANVHGVDGEVTIYPDALLGIAEVLEVYGRHEAAIEKLQVHVANCESQAAVAYEQGVRDQIERSWASALNRLARVALRKYQQDAVADWMLLAIDSVERCRSGLRGAEGRRALPTNAFSTLAGACPGNTVVVLFAMLRQDELNGGFWFSAVLRLRDRTVHFPRFLPLDEIYEKATALGEIFDLARTQVDGKSLIEASRVLAVEHFRLQQALRELGRLLFPDDLVAFVESEQPDRVVMVPESYLLQIPFAALRVGAPALERPLFMLNRNGGTPISVAPSFAHLERQQPDLEASVPRATSITLSLKPAWRGNLASLYGVRKRLDRLFASRGAGSIAVATRTVQQFLDTLADSQNVVFFGHGEVSDSAGSTLLAHDGGVGRYEVDAYAAARQAVAAGAFASRVVVLCACSGLGAAVRVGSSGRDLVGVHMSLLRGGVRCVVGSSVPLFPGPALRLIEHLLDGSAFRPCDVKLLEVYKTFTSHEHFSSPVFWGHLIAFGDGREAIA